MLKAVGGNAEAIRVPTSDGNAKAVLKYGNVRANDVLAVGISVKVKKCR